jgi:cytochrome c oxidase subunit 4
MADTHTGHEHASGHPTWRTYVVIGLILCIITAVEVAIFYIEALASLLVPLLLVLSAAKFVLVVLFYMHLKFDHKMFGRVFYAPLFLGALVVIGMIILFKLLPSWEMR